MHRSQSLSILDLYPQLVQHVIPIRYALDYRRNLIVEEWRGVVNAPLLRTHWIEFLANEAVLRCRRTVVDISRAQIEVKGQEFYDLIQALVTPVLKGKMWITAIIVKTDYQYGVGRQYDAYADSYSDDQIFRSPEKAFEWISTKHHSEAEMLKSNAAGSESIGGW